MESTFWFYFHLGWEHIVDWAALDHLLFLGALCAVYTLADWQRVLVLVTAFTIGHCLSLIAAGTDAVRLPEAWVEALIPATIILTAVYHLFVAPPARDGVTHPHRRAVWVYLTALAFGLVHGLGFSNTFRAMLFPGEEKGLITQLLGFNLGIEAGQILVVMLLLVVGTLWARRVPGGLRSWNWLLSGSALMVAAYLLVERIVGF